MKVFILLLFLSLLAVAEKAAFIDIKKSENLTELRTGDTTYRKGNQSVTLIGAIHIGDAAYYENLNESFKRYDVVLFELIGGEALKGRQPKKAAAAPGADPQFTAITSLYSGYAKSLELSTQTEKIDYTAPNFVHADMSMEDYHRLSKEKNESLFGFALAQSAKLGQQDMSGYLNALLTGNANGQKREVAKTMVLAGSPDSNTIESVVITDRNSVCFQRLNEQLNAGVQNIGIFYGAAHFQDMHIRLSKMGFKPVKHKWRTAWRIPGAPLPDKKG